MQSEGFLHPLYNPHLPVDADFDECPLFKYDDPPKNKMTQGACGLALKTNTRMADAQIFNWAPTTPGLTLAWEMLYISLAWTMFWVVTMYVTCLS
jgi:hypothetical protein